MAVYAKQTEKIVGMVGTAERPGCEGSFRGTGIAALSENGGYWHCANNDTSSLANMWHRVHNFTQVLVCCVRV